MFIKNITQFIPTLNPKVKYEELASTDDNESDVDDPTNGVNDSMNGSLVEHDSGQTNSERSGSLITCLMDTVQKWQLTILAWGSMVLALLSNSVIGPMFKYMEINGVGPFLG